MGTPSTLCPSDTQPQVSSDMFSRPAVLYLLLAGIGCLYLFLTISILEDLRVILKRRPTPLSHYSECSRPKLLLPANKLT